MTTVLNEFEMAQGWRDLPFRAVAKKISESGFPDLESLSVFLDAGVVPRSSREDNHNQLGESLEKYQRVLPNDLVFNKLRTWQGGFGVSDFEGIVSPAYIITRPDKTLIEPRFLGYLLKSKPYLSELTRLSKWMPPTQFDISWESIRDLRLRIPSLEEQQRIAVYLEAQIKVIDDISFKISMLISKNTESLQSKISHKFLNHKFDLVPLRYLSRNVNAKFVGSLPTLSLDLVNARKGTLISDELPITEGETATAMKEGDVAFGKLRPYLGKVFLASSKIFAESEFIVLRSDPNKLISGYLRDFLLSSDTLQTLESKSIGAKMPRTSWDDLANLQIPLPSLKIQQSTMFEIENLRTEAARLDHLGKMMTSSLSDFKSSLITSAVTGQIGLTRQGSVA
jgi:type I restriction enzyme S subunit